PEHGLTTSLLQTGRWRQGRITVELRLDDARSAVRQLADSYDVIFLDGFSPDKNPELWTYDFIRQLAQRLAPDGILATYSSAYPVLGALLRGGLTVGVADPFGRRRGGALAAWSGAAMVHPLPEKERCIVLRSTAGVPYRDPAGQWETGRILRYREQLVARLRRRGIPRWYRERPDGTNGG
ncbi:MAG: MnmC family methyltransferase, partial [Victivallales bacterium]|nr:MnmC family methyltransferase [Victivallales bacterium]